MNLNGVDRTPAPDVHTLRYPRILCLHGGGTNSRIFHMQCRGLQYRLNSYFRLVFVEAPFPSTAGPDVLSVFAECGPFKRWVLTVEPNAVEEQPKETWEAVDRAICDAMDADDRLGATGEWAAVLGFSQGAKTAASILLRQQEAPQTFGRLRRPDLRFRLGVLMAGRGPLLQTDPDDTSMLDKNTKFDYQSNVGANRVLHIPTIHVHGLQDPGLHFHKLLLQDWCDPATTKLIQWNGDHRLPIKTADVALVVDAIMEVARKEGVAL